MLNRTSSQVFVWKAGPNSGLRDRVFVWAEVRQLVKRQTSAETCCLGGRSTSMPARCRNSWYPRAECHPSCHVLPSPAVIKSGCASRFVAPLICGRFGVRMGEETFMISLLATSCSQSRTSFSSHRKGFSPAKLVSAVVFLSKSVGNTFAWHLLECYESAGFCGGFGMAFGPLLLTTAVRQMEISCFMKRNGWDNRNGWRWASSCRLRNSQPNAGLLCSTNEEPSEMQEDAAGYPPKRQRANISWNLIQTVQLSISFVLFHWVSSFCFKGVSLHFLAASRPPCPVLRPQTFALVRWDDGWWPLEQCSALRSQTIYTHTCTYAGIYWFQMISTFKHMFTKLLCKWGKLCVQPPFLRVLLDNQIKLYH